MDSKKQKAICNKYHAAYIETPANLKVGISLNVKSGIYPINGLRHYPEGDTTGWYIWGGEYSDADDFFKPLHVEHLREWCPEAIKYLGLPPGYRFLLGENNYEDVWKDETLLSS